MMAKTVNKYANLAAQMQRLDEIGARLDALAVEAKAVYNARLPKREVADLLAGELSRIRAEFVENPMGARGLVGRLSLHEPFALDRVNPERHLLSLILWIEGEDLVRKARAAVQALDYSEGLPESQRLSRRRELDAERDSLVGEHETLVDGVRALGVQAAHLPETQQRLDRERDAERAEQNAKLNQAEAARRLDAEHVN
jgi:hypothetical protein